MFYNFTVIVLIVSCSVLNLVLSGTKNDCPITCRCDKAKGRAKCWNIMEIPQVPTEIQILDLSDNAIIEIKRSDFKHNTLTDLFLGNNKIKTIDRDAFTDLGELTQLNLSNNQLRGLDKEIFKENKKLKHLYLDNNPDLEFLLSDLPTTVEQLNVANTNIIITYHIIRNMSNLHTYYGNFCRKRNCSHPMEINTKFIGSDDSNNPSVDIETTNEESVPISEKTKIRKVNSETSWSSTNTLLLIGMGLMVVQILLQIYLYKTQNKKISEYFQGTVASRVGSQEPLTSSIR